MSLGYNNICHLSHIRQIKNKSRVRFFVSSIFLRNRAPYLYATAAPNSGYFVGWFSSSAITKTDEGKTTCLVVGLQKGLESLPHVCISN